MPTPSDRKPSDNIGNRCRSCEHYLFARTCKAFAEWIPEEVWLGEDDHSQPIEGDQGLTYQEAEDQSMVMFGYPT